MSTGYSFYLEQEDGIYRYIFVAKSGVRYAVYFAAASEYFGLTYLPINLLAYGYNFGIVLPAAVIKITVILLSQNDHFHAILQEFHETRNKLIEEK